MLNNKCKAEIKMIFDSVGVIDVKRSKNVSIKVANLKQIETKIKSVSNRMWYIVAENNFNNWRLYIVIARFTRIII